MYYSAKNKTNFPISKLIAALTLGLLSNFHAYAGQGVILTGSGDNLRCLGLAGPAGANVAVVAVKCDNNAPIWRKNPDGRIQHGTADPSQSVCLDVDTAHPYNYNKVQVWNCTNSTPINQTWDWAEAGQLRLSSKNQCVQSGPLGQQLNVVSCNGNPSWNYPAYPVGHWRVDYYDLNTMAYQATDYQCLNASGGAMNIYNYFGYWSSFANGTKLNVRAKHSAESKVFTNSLSIDSATTFWGVHQNVYFPNLQITGQLMAKATRIGNC